MIIDAPTPSQDPQLRSLWQEAYGDEDAFMDAFFEKGFSRQRCRCVTWNDRCVAALYWFDCLWEGKKVAYLYAIATDQLFRGKGFCRALMENTHTHLQSLGYAGAVLVPAQEGLFSLYEKLGYRVFCGKELWQPVAAQAGVALEKIGPAAYRAYRDALLPEGSIMHTDAALAFAGSYARFYRGEGVLLCAAVEEETAYFQEYLGSRDALPGVLAALGAQKGRLYLPGQTPYAMYLCLDGSEEMPAYFAIALD